MMKSMSKRASLHEAYTNHNIRPTVVTTLREKGFSKEACMAVTGHKSCSSVDRYDKRHTGEKMSFSEKKKISTALSEGMNGRQQELSEDGIIAIQHDHQIQMCEGNMTRCVTKETHVFTAAPSKKMKITADGENNIVTITFE